MVEDSKVKKYPLRKKPLKPNNMHYDCECGHEQNNHVSIAEYWGVDYNECTICKCPRYQSNGKTWS